MTKRLTLVRGATTAAAPVGTQGRQGDTALTAREGDTPAPRLSNRYPVEDVKLDDLKFNLRQLRSHPPHQIALLAANYKEYGFLGPIIISADNEIVAGEARVLAARQAGFSSVPAIRVTDLSKTQLRGFRLSDNKVASLSDWIDPNLAAEFKELLELNYDIGFTSFSTAEIDRRLEVVITTAEPDPADAAVERPALLVSRRGDVWVLGRHRLHCGDSTTAEAYVVVMGDGRARLIFQDPPYNLRVSHVSGLGKVKHREFTMASGEMPEEGFIAFLEKALNLGAAWLVDGGIAFTCMDWRHWFELSVAHRRANLKLLNVCIWDKVSGGMGSFYRGQWEAVAVLKKGSEPHINNIRLGATGRYRTNLWRYPGLAGFGKGRDEALASHPTVKPVSLVADAIRDASNRGDIILDPFSGSGTTILAAERTGRRGCAIEIDPAYVDVGVRRWEAMTGKRAVLEATGQTFSEVAAARSHAGQVGPEPGTSSISHRVRHRTRTTTVQPQRVEG